MRELAKSLISYGWAVSIYGVQQVTNMVTLKESPAAKAQDIEGLTAGIVGKLGSTARTAFVMGNNIQRAALDLFPGAAGKGDPASPSDEDGTPASAYSNSGAK